MVVMPELRKGEALIKEYAEAKQAHAKTGRVSGAVIRSRTRAGALCPVQ